ncbi:MAG: hypothetical protein ACKVOQ_13100 [Cyclobacteriaceae bacterium]
MDKKPTIGFSLKKITTEQFAVFENAFDEKKKIDINTEIKFGVDHENKIIATFTLFKFEQEQIVFLLIEACCNFTVEEDSWKSFSNTEHKLKIDKGFLSHLAMLTVGTARGILHSKTEGTRFNEYCLPTINVAEMISADALFD